MPIAGDAGSKTLTITARDNEGASRPHEIKLKVNRLPVAISPDVVTLDEDASSEITLTGSDPDGDPLIFFIVQNPASGRLSGSAPNLKYMPNPNYFGQDRFTFKVFDGVGESAPPEPVTIAVRPVNDKPTLSVPGPQVIDEGKNLSFFVTATDADVNDRLSFSATGLPAGANFMQVSANSGEFRWMPSFDVQTRTETVTFTVNDNSATPMTCCDSKTVTITVNDVNRPPVLTVPGPQMWDSGQNRSFSITATDPDAGQTLSFSIIDTTKPPGATFNDISRQFSWAPGFLQNGTHTVSFTVKDNGTPPLSDTKSVTINVTGQWKKAGPIEGGAVRALLVKDTNIFAGMDGGGIFCSSNQGQSWKQVLADWDVRALTAVGNDIFVGTLDKGVFRSSDQGQTWIPVNNGLMDTRILSLATNGATLFAGTFGGGVFRSTDPGQNWTAVNEGLTKPEELIVHALVVSGTNLFAGTDNGGVFRLTNQGQSWQPVNMGLTNQRVFALAVHSANLFAGTGDRVFRSTNNGQSWMPVHSGMEQNTPVNSFFSDSTKLYAGTFDGVFVTTNNGDNWTPVNTGLKTRIFSLALSGAALFAGTDGAGVFRSTNSGQNWEKASNKLTAMAIFALAATGGTTLAGTGGSGIYLSTDDGQSWTATTSGIPPYAWISAFAIIDNTIFAGTDGFGILRSTDRGQNWESVSTESDDWSVLALVTTSTMSGTTLFAGTYEGVFRSTNLGRSWTRVSAGLPNQGKRIIDCCRH
jgi:photosystem II stability/assembly factor-like uncharacterized protein